MEEYSRARGRDNGQRSSHPPLIPGAEVIKMNKQGQSVIEESIGRFNIERLISSSDLGLEYAARDPLLARPVAIHILHPEGSNGISPMRFEMVTKLIASLRHPYIVNLHELGEHEGRPYAVLDVFDGKSIGELATEVGGIAPRIAMRIMICFCQAIHYIHLKGIIHRGIQPAVMGMTPTGDPLLGGLWYAMPSGSGPLKPIGIPGYLSPESMRGEAASPQSDIWALGVSFCELLEGHLLHEGMADDERDRLILSDKPLDLSGLRSNQPDAIVQVIEKCLQKTASSRYRTADELRRALTGALEALEDLEHQGRNARVTPSPRKGQACLVHAELSESELPGQFRQYEIKKLLGAGKYGQVFHAREVFTDRDVALKILREEWVSSKVAVEELRRDAGILSRIRHTNVVSLHNMGRFGTRFFLEFELLKGITLEKILKKRGSLDAIESLVYFLQVIEGLQAIHTSGIVHSNLKPSNIISYKGRVVIFDFGPRGAESAEKIPLPGESAEALLYMAPEQIENKNASYAVDIYAAGVVLYQCLTERFPYDASSLQGIIRQKMVEPPIPIDERRSDLPSLLTNMVDMMLSRNARMRPSANDIKVIIKEILMGLT